METRESKAVVSSEIKYSFGHVLHTPLICAYFPTGHDKHIPTLTHVLPLVQEQFALAAIEVEFAGHEEHGEN
jgi:hypothetical protein